jgi:N-acetylmuramoyl-L-alanine amidase
MKIRRQSRLLSILMGLAFSAGILISGANPAGAAGETAVVAGNWVNVRNGPGTNYGVVAQANLGDQLTVLGQSSDWYNVALTNGGQGWIAGWLVSIQKPAGTNSGAGQVAVLNGSNINIRGGPGTGYEVVAQGGSGERYPVLDKNGDWVKVQLSSGTGWVAGWLVSLESTPSEAPRPDPVTPAIPGSGSKVALVNGSMVNVRSGPGTSNPVIGTVVQGNSLPVLGQSGDWVQVSLPSGGNGWVAGWLVALNDTGPPPVVSPPAPAVTTPAAPGSGSKVAVVNGSVVNVRNGPGTSNEVVGTVTQGNSLPVLGQSGDWVQVSLPSGGNGWVAGWLVALNDTGPPPVVTPPAPAETAPAAPGSGSKVAVVNGSVVNVRNGPGTSNEVVGTVTQGNSLPVLGQSGDWVQVSLPSGGNGWVAGWLVALNDAGPQQVQPPAGQTGGSEVSRGGDRPEDIDDNNDSAKNDDSKKNGKVLSLNVQKTSSDQTTFDIKTDIPVNYNSFILSNPDRLVLNLEGVSPGELPDTKDVSSKTVSKVRTGYFQRDPDITRLVFELKSGVLYEISLSSDKKTINVDTYIPNLAGAYKNRVIVLDPGHGGPDPGAIGPGGTQEKAVTLDIAKRVNKLLEAQGAKVIMARSADTDVSLSARTDIANKKNADIFVSIHINAHTDSSIGGTTTYIYNGSSGTTRIKESSKLANSIQTELVKSLGLRDIGVKSANFAVVRTSNMPAVLIELAFISNPAEEKLLKTDSFKNKAAEAIVRGIGYYFMQKRPA